MFETVHRQGHGRVAHWQPGDRKEPVTTPALIVPDVPQVTVPEWADVVLSRSSEARALPEGPVRLVSGGTWFHPLDTSGAEGDPDALVIPPLQPGPTTDVQLIEVGEDLAVWHDAGGWASNPARAVTPLIDARTRATSGRLLWAPNLGTPADYAVWTYLGVDLFDATPLLMAAVRGTALTVDGPLPADRAAAIYGIGTDSASLKKFNLEQACEELARVRDALGTGSLRSLVERRIYAAPDAVGMLRRLDREHAYLESHTAVFRDDPVPCMTWDSLWMPEVERFRRRVREDHERPDGADVLVLLPCSARKPYKLSKSHRFFSKALDDTGIRAKCHEVMVTSPLGLVPRELEEMYPAAHYDVPVTGEWNQDEVAIMRQQLAAMLERGDYSHVVAHVPDGTYDAIADLLPEGHVHTAQRSPQSIAECERLRDTLLELKEEVGRMDPRAAGNARKAADLRALATYQFGPEGGAALTDGVKAKGRPPYVKLFRQDGEQVGMTTGERGFISLTLPGAKRLAEAGVKRVWIQDFMIKKTSSLFAVGVRSADPDVRPGDDVAVVCLTKDGVRLRGCGQARMSAEEMAHATRGVAVQVRHNEVDEAIADPTNRSDAEPDTMEVTA